MAYEQNALNTVLLPEFQAWTDQWGLVQNNDQNITTGNGILYTAHYALGLIEKKLMTEREWSRIKAVFETCSVLPGLYKRAPAGKDGDYQSHDDLIGILSAEARMRPDRTTRVLSQQILDYGKAVRADEVDTLEQDPKKISMNKLALLALKVLQIPRKYVWNSKNPGKFHVSPWLGKRFDVTATMRLAAGDSINPFHWLYWAYHMLSFKKSDSHDAYILRFHMAMAAEGYGKLTNLICDRVRSKIEADYGNLGFLVGDYFQKPHHPLVNLMKNVK